MLPRVMKLGSYRAELENRYQNCVGPTVKKGPRPVWSPLRREKNLFLSCWEADRWSSSIIAFLRIALAKKATLLKFIPPSGSAHIHSYSSLLKKTLKGHPSSRALHGVSRGWHYSSISPSAQSYFLLIPLAAQYQSSMNVLLIVF